MLPTYTQLVPLLQSDGGTNHKNDCFCTSQDSLFIKVQPVAHMNNFVQKGLILLVLSYTVRLSCTFRSRIPDSGGNFMDSGVS